jgi:predicted DNA-binding transcriptional regulator AlpA
MTEPKILVPATEAARLLSMSRSSFFSKVKAGKLPQPVRDLGAPKWRMADLVSVGSPASQPTKP